MWQEYIIPATTDEAIQFLSNGGASSRIVSGCTDIMLEMERGVRKGITTLIDISRVVGLDQIELDENDIIHLGPNVTHNQVAASRLLQTKAFPLVQAAWQVGSPQIRNRGTIAGNLITASPANDTITPLIALDAQLRLKSLIGERVVPLREFYQGVRKTVMQADEMLVDIFFPAMPDSARGIFVKYALRKAQAISIINLAIILDVEDGIIQKAEIALGAVAPTIVHAIEAGKKMLGQPYSNDLLSLGIGDAAVKAIHPIDDIRGSAAYRDLIVKTLINRALESLLSNSEREGFPVDPVLLWGKQIDQVGKTPSVKITKTDSINTSINGQYYSLGNGQSKNLLRFIREDAGLIGVKEGCSEGECGACTIFLDGKAVMACLVPAPRAHGAVITTIEGVSIEPDLHPVQQSFIDEGAVQCGYCTPGFVMSAVKLLEEKPHPTRDQIKQSITGNLCRCTGYYKIVNAIEKASQDMK